jgi:hypothetical protein
MQLYRYSVKRRPSSPIGPPAQRRTPNYWRKMLNQAPLDGRARAAYTDAIEGWLDYYAITNLSLTVESARWFISDKARRENMADAALWKAGLN